MQCPRAVPTIREILDTERSCPEGEVVLFLEGKFWKAYEQSAYKLTKLFGFKPSKRFVKLVGEEVISVGFPSEQLQKYLKATVVDGDGKRCRANVYCPVDDLAFREWKLSAQLREPKAKMPPVLVVPEEWKPRTQVMKEENLPVFKLVYDLLLRIFHATQKMDRDYRYTLGEDLKRQLLRTEVCIYRAHGEASVQSKVGYISEALERMLEVRLTVRILHDSKQLSLKSYALLCEQMVAVEKNLADWKKYHINNIKNEKTDLF